MTSTCIRGKSSWSRLCLINFLKLVFFNQVESLRGSKAKTTSTEVNFVRTVQDVNFLTRSVFLAPSVLLAMIVPGPPMEQTFFSRAPPQTGTVDTAKSWTGGVWNKTLRLHKHSPLYFKITKTPFMQRQSETKRSSRIQSFLLIQVQNVSLRNIWITATHTGLQFLP